MLLQHPFSGDGDLDLQLFLLNGSVGFMSVLVGETFVIALLPSPDLPSSDALGDNVGDLQSANNPARPLLSLAGTPNVAWQV
jgi:hypothetical protein